MNSNMCPRCGRVSWAASVCRSCGEQLPGAHEQWQQADWPATGDAQAAAQPNTQSTPYAAPRRLETPGLAVASLIVGIISLCTVSFLLVGAIAGIWLGVAALMKIKRAPARYSGQGLAIGGIVTSALSLVTALPFLFIAALAVPAFTSARRAANEAETLNALRAVAANEETYRASAGHGSYGTLSDMMRAGLIDERLTGSTAAGYRFQLAAERTTFVITATPLQYPSSGRRSFYLSNDGVVHAADKQGLSAGLDDPVLVVTKTDEDPFHAPSDLN